MMVRVVLALVWVGGWLWAASGEAETHYETFQVMPLDTPITVDGAIEDWGAQGHEQGRQVSLTNSDWEESEQESVDSTSSLEKHVRIWTGYHKEHFYLAAQWRDETQNAIYKPWKLSQENYQRTRTVDDMFVVRLKLDDSFQQCMLSNNPYRTDIWRWSAGRSNLSGVADDMLHAFSKNPFDKPAREYEGKNGTVYFLNVLDAGYSGWQTSPQPKAGSGPVVASIVKAGEPAGSRADVLAVGKWQDGVWTLEMSRNLNTKDPDDAVFVIGGKNVMQFAIFYAGYKLRKFITQPIVFQFAARKLRQAGW
ncbi:MAG: ethylbenzene dehydrogenase-related protein, partial [Magnetococcus sp. YQC-5]